MRRGGQEGRESGAVFRDNFPKKRETIPTAETEKEITSLHSADEVYIKIRALIVC